jgi:sec-independent protein translocase protein TatA
MEIFGFSAAKILLILTIAIVLFGPDKVPEMAAQVGRVIRDFRRFTREMTQEFNEATGGLREEFTTIAQDLQGELAETQADLRRQLDLTGTFGETGGASPLSQGDGVFADDEQEGDAFAASQVIADAQELSQAMPHASALVVTAWGSDSARSTAPASDPSKPHATRTEPLADLAVLTRLTPVRKSRAHVVGRSVAASRYLRRPSARDPRQAPAVRPVSLRGDEAGDPHRRETASFRPLAAD